jgi:hypothetical protein
MSWEVLSGCRGGAEEFLVLKVDGVGPVGILGDDELDLALVLETETQGLLYNLLGERDGRALSGYSSR